MSSIAFSTNHSSRLSFQVDGIRCANCALSIERSLGQLAGIHRIRTNVADKRVVVDLDPDLLDQAKILHELSSIGFEGSVGDDVESTANLDSRHLLARMGVAGIGMMQVMMFALANYVAGEGGMAPSYVALMSWASFTVATPVALYAAWPFHHGAFKDLSYGRAGMDVPVSLAILSAYGLSSWHMVTGGEIYFDSVCMFSFFLLVGRYLEHRSRQAYGHSVSMAEQCVPELADVVNVGPVPVKALAIDTLVSVMPGQVVPVDGVVESGSSSVSEAAFTGESDPIRKSPGQQVLAGSMNLDGEMCVRSSCTADEFVIARLSDMHQEAMLYKPGFAKLADVVARYFIAGVLVLAASTAAYWYLAGNPEWFVVMITVLVVSCPCALSLATPVAYTVAVTALKRKGVVVRNGKFLERLSSVNHIVFDKTGTLTEGRLEVSEVRLIDSGWSEKQVLEHCTALEKTSKHPIARAFSIPSDLSAANVSVIPGEGVSGTIQNTTYRLGKTQFVGFDELAVPDGEGIWVLLGSEQPIAWIRLNDDIRPSSIALISQLKNRFKTTLLSGDRTVEVNRVAALLGLTSTYGDKTPADKLTAIRDYQANGDCVLMVGDGVNDAAAMGAADAAIAISPVDILVQDAADATLLRQDILNISMLLNYSRRLRRIIRQNISWAAIYNFSVIPMAALGLLEPWMAALGMSMSSLLVVMNANRLARTETH